MNLDAGCRPAKSLLIAAAEGPALQGQAPGLAEALRQPGTPVLTVVPCNILVREAVRLAPQAVVAIAGHLAHCRLAGARQAAMQRLTTLYEHSLQMLMN